MCRPELLSFVTQAHILGSDLPRLSVVQLLIYEMLVHVEQRPQLMER